MDAVVAAIRHETGLVRGEANERSKREPSVHHGANLARTGSASAIG